MIWSLFFIYRDTVNSCEITWNHVRLGSLNVTIEQNSWHSELVYISICCVLALGTPCSPVKLLNQYYSITEVQKNVQCGKNNYGFIITDFFHVNKIENGSKGKCINFGEKILRVTVWLGWHLLFQQSNNTWEDLRACVGSLRALVCGGEWARPGHGCLLHGRTADERVLQSTWSNPRRIAFPHRMDISIISATPLGSWTKQKYLTCVLLVAYNCKITGNWGRERLV